jgi:hypothetical protein
MCTADVETWLIERLKYHGVDVYAGDFETLQERLGYVIVINQVACVIAGRYEGKPKSYGEIFEKLYSTKLPKVPRTEVKTGS